MKLEKEFQIFLFVWEQYKVQSNIVQTSIQAIRLLKLGQTVSTWSQEFPSCLITAWQQSRVKVAEGNIGRWRNIPNGNNIGYCYWYFLFCSKFVLFLLQFRFIIQHAQFSSPEFFVSESKQQREVGRLVCWSIGWTGHTVATVNKAI